MRVRGDDCSCDFVISGRDHESGNCWEMSWVHTDLEESERTDQTMISTIDLKTSISNVPLREKIWDAYILGWHGRRGLVQALVRCAHKCTEFQTSRSL